MKRLILALTALLALGSSAREVLGVTYQIIELGDSEVIPSAINASGQVVGRAPFPGSIYWHPFLWSEGQMTDLGTLGGIENEALGINASGQVVGVSDRWAVTSRAFLWSNGQMTDLGTLGGPTSTARGINDAGQVVGEAEPSGASSHAFLWTNGHMADLGTPLVGESSSAYAINNRGQVVGNAAWNGFLWSNDQMTDFSALSGWRYTWPEAINDLGQVVGQGVPPHPPGYPPSYDAFLWSDGQMTDLSTLGIGPSVAHAINNLGQVVGTLGQLADMPDQGGGGFLYSNGQMTNLDDLIDPALGWRVAFASGINDSGQIVGWGTHNGREKRGFLMTPIPEPSTIALLASAAALLAYVWRRTAG